MTRRATVSRIVIGLLAVSLSTGCVFAQAKQQVSLRIPFENLKFDTSQSVEVGDVPNHIVRVFDLHYILPANMRHSSTGSNSRRYGSAAPRT